MDPETAQALADINRAFYRDRAEAFSATRERPWPGWSRVLACLEGSPRPLRVLDVGCGNGRFASFLAQEQGGRLESRRTRSERNASEGRGPSASDERARGPARPGERFDYVGVDASEGLLARARARQLGAGRARFLRADWALSPPERALPPGTFSLVVIFGVLHHVPGAARRRALLEAAARRLAPGGVLALTAWRFEASPRLRARLVTWEEYNRGAARPVDPARLEPGDRLLRWGERESGGVRYCHFADDTETDRLAAGLGLERLAAYCADGRNGDRNRYLVLRARP